MSSNLAWRLRQHAEFLAANYNDLSSSEAQVIIRGLESIADGLEEMARREIRTHPLHPHDQEERALRAIMEAQRGRLVLVPTDPTPKMMEWGVAACSGPYEMSGEKGRAEITYRYMIAAAGEK